MKNKKKIILIGAIVLVLIVGLIITLVLIKKPKKEESVETKTAPENTQTQGLNIVDVNSKSRPYAVMINNAPAARPFQSGLQDAYLIYELEVEGGLTRYMALFKDKETSAIGSIRSSRHYYLDYALENDAIYVHWGWSPQAQSDISSLGINNINGLSYEGTYFYRDKSLNADLEHTGFTKMEMLKKATDKLGYRKETDKGLLLNYSVDPIDLSGVTNAKVANEVVIEYSNSITTKYVYDADSKTYLRYVNGKANSDYVTKNQYTAKNIITYQVNYNTISGDEKGRQEMGNIGTGSGYFITNGYAIPIKWSKESRSSKTKYMYEDGTELNVSDGNTYIQIQPKGKTLTID